MSYYYNINSQSSTFDNSFINNSITIGSSYTGTIYCSSTGLSFNNNIVPTSTNLTLGSLDQPWRSIYVSTGTVFIGPTGTLVINSNGLISSTEGFASPYFQVGATNPGQGVLLYEQNNILWFQNQSGATGPISIFNIAANSVNNTFFTGGNIGVGTSTPDFPLDVAGDIRCNTIYGNLANGLTGPVGPQGNVGNPGLSSGLYLYLNAPIQTNVSPNYLMQQSLTGGSTYNYVSTLDSNESTGLNTFQTDYLLTKVGPVIEAGLWYSEIHSYVGVGDSFDMQLQFLLSTGAGTQPFLIGNSNINTLTSNTSEVYYFNSPVNANYDNLGNDAYLLLKINATNNNPTQGTITTQFLGPTYSYTTTTLAIAIPTGPIGPQGFQGLIGATGPQGVQGVQGFQGFIGNTGPQGFQGVQGFQGFIGNTGSQGFQGLRGATGPQGFQGVQGYQGFIGNTGPQGFQGVQGYQGFIGNTGPQGFQGFQGFIGNTGPQGFQGLIGSTGPGFTSITNIGSGRLLTDINSNSANAEANLTFTGTTLSLTGTANITSMVQIGSSNIGKIYFSTGSTTGCFLEGVRNATGASNLIYNSTTKEITYTTPNYLYAYYTGSQTTSATSYTGVLFNKTPILDGFTHTTNSALFSFTADTNGIYQISYSLEVHNNNTATETLTAYLDIDGIAIEGSCRSITLAGTTAESGLSHIVLSNISSGSHTIQVLMQSSNATRISIQNPNNKPGPGLSGSAATLTIHRII